VDDIVDVLKELGPDQVEVEQAIDMEEDGFETQGSSSTEPPGNTNYVGEQKGVNKRIHEKIVALGHKIHPSQSQRMNNVTGNNPTGSINANSARTYRNSRRAGLQRSLNRHLKMRQTHLGQPKNPFSPMGMGQQRLLYDIKNPFSPMGMGQQRLLYDIMAMGQLKMSSTEVPVTTLVSVRADRKERENLLN
jgi:hypothetical protein